MTSLPTNDNQVFGTRARRRDSPAFRTTGTPALLTTPSPPAKPKRSFRDKEKAEGTAYLEGCDYNQVEEETRRRAEGEVEEEMEETTKVSFCLQEDERSQSETEEDKSSMEREEEDGEAPGERVEQRAENQDAAEEERDGEDRGQKADESEEQESTSEDEGSVKNEDGTRQGETGGEEPAPGSSRRRSRVIRLYQYDEDGQRYGHLPDPAPEAPEPAPRLKQRSLSLTRLNAIMAAASAGPMERVEPAGQQGEEERPGFQMQI